MKLSVVLIFSFLVLQKNFSQISGSVVKYNGIDTFLLGDPKVKFGNNITYMPSGDQKWETKFYTVYNYHKDSLVPILIDTIQFRNLIFNFTNDTLSDLNLINHYSDKVYKDSINCKSCKYSYINGGQHFEIIKSYLQRYFGKKGKYKNYPTFRNGLYYGYQWKTKGVKVLLTIQYDSYYPQTCLLNLLFATKYSPFW